MRSPADIVRARTAAGGSPRECRTALLILFSRERPRPRGQVAGGPVHFAHAQRTPLAAGGSSALGYAVAAHGKLWRAPRRRCARARAARIDDGASTPPAADSRARSRPPARAAAEQGMSCPFGRGRTPALTGIAQDEDPSARTPRAGQTARATCGVCAPLRRARRAAAARGTGPCADARACGARASGLRALCGRDGAQATRTHGVPSADARVTSCALGGAGVCAARALRAGGQAHRARGTRDRTRVWACARVLSVADPGCTSHSVAGDAREAWASAPAEMRVARVLRRLRERVRYVRGGLGAAMRDRERPCVGLQWRKRSSRRHI